MKTLEEIERHLGCSVKLLLGSTVTLVYPKAILKEDGYNQEQAIFLGLYYNTDNRIDACVSSINSEWVKLIDPSIIRPAIIKVNKNSPKENLVDDSRPFKIVKESNQFRIIFSKYVDHDPRKFASELAEIVYNNDYVFDATNCKCITVQWLRCLNDLAVLMRTTFDIVGLNYAVKESIKVAKLNNLKGI